MSFTTRWRLVALLPVVAFVAASSSQAGSSADGPSERVLIRADKPYDTVTATVEAAGGAVTHRYKHVDAVAATVPRGALAAVRAEVGASAISKDAVLAAPIPVNRVLPGRGPSSAELDADLVDSFEAIANLPELAATHPDAYSINNAIANVNPLHAAGIGGQGVIVAVIDSGIRPGRPHLTLDGSVIGGEDFVGDGLGFSNNLNDGHGTFVAGMISANVIFSFASTSTFARSVRTHCPSCASESGAVTSVPMIGTAPFSSIYALRVFGPTGGSPTSRILQAMERAIELRELFDAGAPGGINIEVVNMSLGGTTLFAGRDLFDREVDAFLAHDIVVTNSAGNAGPSSLTTSSPGSAIGALTVGAASNPVNERILRDVQFGFGIGSLWRPFSGVQTATFSSRGPNADGRADPDVIASGDANYGQGFATNPNGISLASGTSFAAPSVAGVAALLDQAFPAATARQIRNAIILAANPDVLADNSTELDQGEGFVDAQAAADLLTAGAVPDTMAEPKKPKKKVAQNVKRGTFLEPLKGTVTQTVVGLLPAERADFLYEAREDTAEVRLTLSNFVPGSPQNQLFGNDIFLNVHSAKTSSFNDYKVMAFTTGGTFVVTDPEPGVLRFTVSGDWTNASPVSVDVTLTSTKRKVDNGRTAKGRIAEGQSVEIPVTIPAGATQAVFLTSWKYNWSRYPTNDVDMILVDPLGDVFFDGATLNSPEKAVVSNPAPGTWTVIIDGFEVPSGRDDFELRVTADGKLIE